MKQDAKIGGKSTSGSPSPATRSQKHRKVNSIALETGICAQTQCIDATIHAIGSKYEETAENPLDRWLREKDVLIRKKEYFHLHLFLAWK